jgi:hypothetical protein
LDKKIRKFVSILKFFSIKPKKIYRQQSKRWKKIILLVRWKKNNSASQMEKNNSASQMEKNNSASQMKKKI